MRDYLIDIVKHTYVLGNIDLVKITGDAMGCSVDAMSEDRSVVVQAQFKEPIAEFQGTFGMPNLGKLNVILNIPEYSRDGIINVETKDINGSPVPASLKFSNKSGDFKNNYRFMSPDLVSDRVKVMKFKGVNWNVTFEPLVANILRLKYQAQANSEENFFIAKTDGGDLKFYFGDHSTHAGNFVFQAGVQGHLNTAWKWPVGVVQGILGLDGDKTMYFSDSGAVQITVDSGLCVYNYILPAQSK
jgi:hypothetical protein